VHDILKKQYRSERARRLVKFFKNRNNVEKFNQPSRSFRPNYWHDLSYPKAIGNKKLIEMAQKGLFLPFLVFSQTKTKKTECFFLIMPHLSPKKVN
jgi:hypothetical protein